MAVSPWRRIPGWAYASGLFALALIPDFLIVGLLSKSPTPTNAKQKINLADMQGGNSSHSNNARAVSSALSEQVENGRERWWLPKIDFSDIDVKFPKKFEYGYDTICDMHHKDFKLHNVDELFKKHKNFHSSTFASPVGCLILMWYACKLLISYIFIPSIPFPTADKWKVKYQESKEAIARKTVSLNKEEVAKAIERFTAHGNIRPSGSAKAELVPLDRSSFLRGLVLAKRGIVMKLTKLLSDSEAAGDFFKQYHTPRGSVDSLLDWLCPDGVPLQHKDFMSSFFRDFSTGHWLNYKDVECLDDRVELVMNRLTDNRDALWLLFTIASGKSHDPETPISPGSEAMGTESLTSDIQPDIGDVGRSSTMSSVATQEDPLQKFILDKFPMENRLPLFIQLREMLPGSPEFNSSKTKRYVRSALNFPAVKGFGSWRVNLPWSQQTQVIIWFAQAFQTLAEIVLTCLNQKPDFAKFYQDPYWMLLTFRAEVILPILYMCGRIAMLYYPLVRMSGIPVWRPVGGGPLQLLKEWPLKILFFGLSVPVCVLMHAGGFTTLPLWIWVALGLTSFRLFVGIFDEWYLMSGKPEPSKMLWFASMMLRVLGLVLAPLAGGPTFSHLLAKGNHWDTFALWVLFLLHFIFWARSQSLIEPRSGISTLAYFDRAIDFIGSWNLVFLSLLLFSSAGVQPLPFFIYGCIFVSLVVYHARHHDERSCQLWDVVSCETRFKFLFLLPVPLLPYVPSLFVQVVAALLAFHAVHYVIDKYSHQMPAKLREPTEAFTQTRDLAFLAFIYLVLLVFVTKFAKLFSMSTYICTFSGIEVAPSFHHFHVGSVFSYVIILLCVAVAGVVLVGVLTFFKRYFPWLFSEAFFLNLWAFHCNDILSVALREDAYALVSLVQWAQLDHDEFVLNNYTFGWPIVVMKKDGSRKLAIFQEADGYGEYSVEEKTGVSTRYTANLQHIGLQERARVRVWVDDDDDAGWRYGKVTAVDVCVGKSMMLLKPNKSKQAGRSVASGTVFDFGVSGTTDEEGNRVASDKRKLLDVFRSRVCYKVKFDNSPFQEYVEATELEFAVWDSKRQEHFSWMKLVDFKPAEHSSLRVLTFIPGELIRSQAHKGGSFVGKVSAIDLEERRKVHLGRLQRWKDLNYELDLKPYGHRESIHVSEQKLKTLFLPLKVPEETMVLPQDGDRVRLNFGESARAFNRIKFFGGSVWDKLVQKIRGTQAKAMEYHFKGEVHTDKDWIKWDDVQPGLLIYSFDHNMREHPYLKHANSLMAKFDMDGDGALNRLEFAEAFSYMQDASKAGDAEKLFTGGSGGRRRAFRASTGNEKAAELLYKFDANNDGVLEKYELRRAFTQVTRDAEDEAKKEEEEDVEEALESSISPSGATRKTVNRLVSDEAASKKSKASGASPSMKPVTETIEYDDDKVVIEVQAAPEQNPERVERSTPDEVFKLDAVPSVLHEDYEDVLSAKKKAEEECEILQKQVQEMSKTREEMSKTKEECMLLQKQVDSMSKLKDDSAALQQQAADLSQAKQECAVLQQQVQDLSKAKEECIILQQQVADMSKLRDDSATMQQQAADLSKAREESLLLQQQVADMSRAKEECALLQQQVADMSNAKEECALLQQQIAEVSQAKEGQRVLLQQQIADMSKAKEECMLLQEQVQDMNKVKDEGEQLKQQLESMSKVAEEVEQLKQQLLEAEKRAAAAEGRSSPKRSLEPPRKQGSPPETARPVRSVSNYLSASGASTASMASMPAAKPQLSQADPSRSRFPYGTTSASAGTTSSALSVPAVPRVAYPASYAAKVADSARSPVYKSAPPPSAARMVAGPRPTSPTSPLDAPRPVDALVRPGGGLGTPPAVRSYQLKGSLAGT